MKSTSNCVPMNPIFVSVLICAVVVEISSFKTFSALNSIVFTNIPTPKADVHSEYYFGKCATRHRDLLNHEHFKYEQIKGSIIVRGHLLLTERLPNCVYIKASSAYGDMVRYNSYKFTVCFVKIQYYYTGEFYTSDFYEWYLPVEMQEGIDWDLYFFYV